MRKTLVSVLLVLASLPALALGPRMEWGVLAGIHVPGYTTSDNLASIKNRMGWQAGMTVSLGFNSWAINPQILYLHQGIRIDEAASLSLRSHSIDVPVLLNKRLLRIVHLYAGPVFTVMNNCKLKDAAAGGNFDFGQLRSSVSYAVGANVRLMKHLMIDLRYNGQFRNKHNIVLPGGGTLDKLDTYNVALSVGYIF